MSADLQGFDANDIPDDVLPVGTYQLIVTHSEKKESKNKPGNSYLSMRFQVVSGDRQGFSFFQMFNLWNTNNTAVAIAQRDLAGLCKAVGVLRPRNSSELHDKPFRAEVKIQDSDMGPQNQIKKYLEPSAAGSPAPKSAPAAAPVQDESVPPWKRGKAEPATASVPSTAPSGDEETPF